MLNMKKEWKEELKYSTFFQIEFNHREPINEKKYTKKWNHRIFSLYHVLWIIFMMYNLVQLLSQLKICFSAKNSYFLFPFKLFCQDLSVSGVYFEQMPFRWLKSKVSYQILMKNVFKSESSTFPRWNWGKNTEKEKIYKEHWNSHKFKYFSLQILPFKPNIFPQRNHSIQNSYFFPSIIPYINNSPHTKKSVENYQSWRVNAKKKLYKIIEYFSST